MPTLELIVTIMRLVVAVIIAQIKLIGRIKNEYSTNTEGKSKGGLTMLREEYTEAAS